MIMNVYLVDDVDYIVAETRENVLKYCYEELSYDENDEPFIVEKDIYSNSMWYGFDIRESDRKNTLEFLEKYKDKSFQIKYDVARNFDVVMYLTFAEIIEIDKITETTIIASKEW